MAHQGHWNRTRPAPTTVMPDLPDAEHWRTTLSAVSLTFGILASAVFVLRVCVARCSSCKIRAEDVIMGVGVVLMWGTIASVLLKAYNGMGIPARQIPRAQRHLLNLGSFLIPKFWAGSTACCKVAIILFLQRVVGFKRSVHTALIVVAVISVLWALGVIFFTTFACTPVSFYWNKSGRDGHCMSRHRYKNGNIVFGVLGMVTDFVVLVIPMPTLWKSQMRRKQKIAMTGVLGIGLVVCIFSLLRTIQFFYLDLDKISSKSIDLVIHDTLTAADNVPTASSGLESIWTVLENEFAVICGCAPQLAPLFQSLRPRKAKTSGYAGMYDTSVLGKHTKMSVIRTTVSGTTGGDVMPGLRTVPRDGRSSSEIELKGIEVRTAINQEISASGDAHHDPGRLSRRENSGSYTRI
ncbi:integral membrane [Cordyceps militaris]|uniref:Integral membrane n=1 Tax=Cordyceps militaris TaxID=73501 RepID=A0A2H4S7G6_CORMI|nr:integral membrane [Cordyceps militaris]